MANIDPRIDYLAAGYALQSKFQMFCMKVQNGDDQPPYAQTDEIKIIFSIIQTLQNRFPYNKAPQNPDVFESNDTVKNFASDFFDLIHPFADLIQSHDKVEVAQLQAVFNPPMKLWMDFFSDIALTSQNNELSPWYQDMGPTSL